MSEYIILPRTKQIAKENNLTVRPAKNPKYKIDVIRGRSPLSPPTASGFADKGGDITSIGAKGYADYPNYLKQEKAGKVASGYADKRRKLYLTRHKDDDKIKGKLAKLLLWS